MSASMCRVLAVYVRKEINGSYLLICIGVDIENSDAGHGVKLLAAVRVRTGVVRVCIVGVGWVT